ncbi:MAG: GDP-mannose 4,6-dehydratase [Desulfobacula sp.]|nr:GDP-mannose 4,6-dehydratase [Desulfobacula sp.]
MHEKIVVIGSNSFSGSHFVNKALETGMEVVGISRSAEPDSIFLPYKWKDKMSLEKFKFFQYDLNFNLQDIADLIYEFKPDYIANFAAQGMVAQSWENPEQWFLTNTISAAGLINRIHSFPFIKKYIQISTPEVYGTNEHAVSENTNYNPSTPYAVSKAAADMNLMAYHKAYGFPVIITRAANVFGPGQQLYRIIPRAVLYFCLEKKLFLHGGGHSRRSFIHIEDVVDGTLKAIHGAEPGEIFHFATLKTITIRELVKMIAQIMGVSFKQNIIEAKELTGKDSAYILNSDKAKEKLGWNPGIDLEQGLNEVVSWVNANINNLRNQSFDYIYKP